MKWPAIVQFDGDDELEVIVSANDWLQFKAQVKNDCRVITSDGCIVELSLTPDSAANNNQPKTCDSELTMTTEEAVQLARKHMAAQELCCVAKFNAVSVADVIDAVIKLETD